MSNAFRTMIVPAGYVTLARDIAATLSPSGGTNMWITGLSDTGNNPPTDYVSTGAITEEFAVLMPEQVWEYDAELDTWDLIDDIPGDPVALYNMCVAAGMSVTQAQIDDLFANCDVTEQEPFVAFDRLGLKIITGDI